MSMQSSTNFMSNDSVATRQKLIGHIAIKGVQLGSILGTILVFPINLVRFYTLPSIRIIGNWAAKGSFVGAL
eukprot:Awhi_evm1s10758